jgi:excinuclease ABC subunit B
VTTPFKINTKFAPAGDQPQAIEKLLAGLKRGFDKQILLGVTGSGKTFTAANVIAAHGKPALVIAHNKTLAAQLVQEYRDFFPENEVHYFVSYYDYYQPEAYMPITDTYIEKDAKINEEIDRLRHAATAALLTRKDVIVVASVSCIYGLGSPREYQASHLVLSVGQAISRQELIKKLINIHYERTNADLSPGLLRAVGNRIEVMPPGEEMVYIFTIADGVISKIEMVEGVSRVLREEPAQISLFPAKHFITQPGELKRAIKDIKAELAQRLAELEKEGKPLEAERLKRRTNYDLAMLAETGYCQGVENYSRHLSGRRAGEAPDTLLSYFPDEFLTVIDESHVTLSQLAGMYAGDQSRKKTLIEHGFRLPSALDNRPLKFEEFSERVGQIIYTSATPGKVELEQSEQVVEQIIRPTGLVDPVIEIKPVAASGAYLGQVKDLIAEAEKTIAKGDRVMITTLTKKMAEDLSAYLKEAGIKSEYLHSDVKTMDRIKVLTAFRQGAENGGFDCLVGVNLLREGLDLPEVSLIGILDADKEGFLRSETSLIQTIGRAARNVDGRVILYADQVTGSLERAVKETNRRRDIQLAYNKKHGITPKTIIKKIQDITQTLAGERERTVSELLTIDLKAAGGNAKKLIKAKEKQMNAAVKNLDFETAAILRDEIKALAGLLDK